MFLKAKKAKQRFTELFVLKEVKHISSYLHKMSLYEAHSMSYCPSHAANKGNMHFYV